MWGVCVRNHTYGCANSIRFAWRRKPSGIVFVWSKVQRFSLSHSHRRLASCRDKIQDLILDHVDRKWQVTLFGIWLSQTPMCALVLIDSCKLKRRWHVWCCTWCEIRTFIENKAYLLCPVCLIKLLKCLCSFLTCCNLNLPYHNMFSCPPCCIYNQ